MGYVKTGVRLLIVVGAAGLAIMGVANPANAVEVHTLDPVLSLTGNCEVEPVDQIPDPGCPEGDHPPAGRFTAPAGITVDSYGDIYVASSGGSVSNRRIDVFDADGHFATEVGDPNAPGPMAVDSKGNLYVSNHFKETGENIVRYSPTVYKPDEGLIEYGNTPKVLVKNGESNVMGLAVEPTTDRLWIKFGGKAELRSPAVEDNELIEAFEGDFGGEGLGIAVDSANERLYAGSLSFADGVFVQAYDLATPHTLLFTIKGPAVPSGKFFSGALALAVDEGTGHLYVFDGAAKNVYEFDHEGNYLATISVNIEKTFEYVERSTIAVDNGENSPNGVESLLGRYLYVPSGLLHTHSLAFGPSNEGPPSVKSISFTNVGEGEVKLSAAVEPFGLSTHYTFEYVTRQQFEENGFSDAQVAGEGEIPAGNAPVSVAAAAEGLEPGTPYRFRVVAENTEGSDESEGEFATYSAAETYPLCPNDPLRTGPSTLLPDCRAYELVTPPGTNARSPHGAGASNLGSFFFSPEASAAGEAVSFEIEGGAIPGSESTGSLAGDPYLSSRGAAGWSTSYVGPTGLEAPVILPGSHSPDQGYSFWTGDSGRGSASVEGEGANYVRYPDGHSALVGRGSLADDPRARGQLIGENGDHIIFVSTTFHFAGGDHSALQLEPNAPPSGTDAIYDRTADEVTHVVSLLLGDETPAAGEDATYEGASLDGKGVAFSIGNKLYLRYNNEETYELGEGVTFAGIAEGGARAFYLKGGKLWRFDATNEERTEFSSGPVTPVNVAANGNVAYFVSQSVLTSEPNPNGQVAKGGEENLYRSEEGAISFVGTVTERDVVGELGNELTGGLGLWTEMVGSGRLANDPSRTTPDGSALVFESRAVLDGYGPEGHAEVYRYDFAGNELDCLSCNPTLAPASGDASLQSVSHELGGLEPLSAFSLVPNLSHSGRRVFFQSMEALVPEDTDGLQDVYEWEAGGVGSCARAEGCIYLISSGDSLRTDYLYAASDSGDDVFFRSADVLLRADLEETPSIYDARVNGGFAEECQGEQCRPLLPPSSSSAAPLLPDLATRGIDISGNAIGKPCSKGKRKARRHGKLICIKKKKHHKHPHRKTDSKRGARK